MSLSDKMIKEKPCFGCFDITDVKAFIKELKERIRSPLTKLTIEEINSLAGEDLIE